MGKRVQVCDGGFVSYPHPFLPCVFKPGIVTFAFCAEGVIAFKVSAVPVDGEAKVVRNGNVLGAATVLSAIVKVFVVAGAIGILGCFQRAAELLARSAVVRELAILPHGKPGFADGISLWEKLGVLGIAPVQWDDAFPVIQFIDFVVNVFDIIALIRKERAFRHRKEGVGAGKDVEGDRGIRHFGGRSQLVNGKTGNTVHEDVVFITPVKFMLFFVYLVGGGVDTEFAVLVRFWLVVLLKFIGAKRLGVIL